MNETTATPSIFIIAFFLFTNGLRLGWVRLDLSRGGAAPQSTAERAAERLVANFEATQKLLDGFCHHLRNKVSNHR
jgi:hypothetical protein